MTKYLFHSQRLGFRLLSHDDLENYAKLDTDPTVREFFPAGVININQVKQNIQKNIDFYKQNQFGVLVAIELASGNFVGRCGFGKLPSGEIEVGYVFLPAFWSKGYATEALIRLLEWAKDNMNVADYIIAYTPTGHQASIRVMQKAGMTFMKNAIEDNEELVYYRFDISR